MLTCACAPSWTASVFPSVTVFCYHLPKVVGHAGRITDKRYLGLPTSNTKKLWVHRYLLVSYFHSSFITENCSPLESADQTTRVKISGSMIKVGSTTEGWYRRTKNYWNDRRRNEKGTKAETPCRHEKHVWDVGRMKTTSEPKKHLKCHSADVQRVTWNSCATNGFSESRRSWKIQSK